MVRMIGEKWIGKDIEGKGGGLIKIYSLAALGSWPLFQFLNPYTVGRTPWTGGSARRKTATYTQNNTNTE
jgi:hypothetical protein